MNVKYLRHDEIDKEAWDACIGASANCNVYGLSWYLDIVSPGWQALIDSNYHTVMPLTSGKKFGINYLFQPDFVQQLGIYSTETLKAEDVKAFLDAIPGQFRLVEIRLNSGNTFPNDAKGVTYHHNFELNLSADYESLSANYHSNTKRNLAKASGFGLHLVRNAAIDDVIALFRMNRGAKVSAWGNAEYDTFRKLVKEAIARGAAFVYGVSESDDNQIVAGALFMKSHDRLVFLFSGCCEAGKAKQAMTFMFDQVIQEYCNTPVTLDFEGSDDENLARFYHGFGSIDVPYPGFSECRMSGIGKILLRCWKSLKH